MAISQAATILRIVLTVTPTLPAACTNRDACVELFDITFDAVNFSQAVDRIIELANAATPSYVVTANVDHVVRFHKQPEVRPFYEEADMVLADGMPLIWASKLIGRPLPQRVAGSDLFPALCEQAAANGLSVFLMGGSPGVAEQAVMVLKERHPDIKIVGTCCPEMGFENDESQRRHVVDTIRDAKPDILFVALGSPKQERWIYEHRNACQARLSIGIGISFSFLCGDVRRAPRWMQKLSLEWLHRLCQEPGRLWKRYLIEDSYFAVLVVKQWLRRGQRASKPVD